MEKNESVLPVLQPPILSYLKDLPNLCSLAGLGCTLLAICFSILGNYPAAMIGMVWAVSFDWADGLIARRMQGRTGNDQALGGQLDVLIDIVSYGVAPAVLLMSYGNFEPLFIAAAFVMLSAGALRLSYFATYGLAGGKHYTGLAIDNNNLILVFVFVFESLFSEGIFSAVLFVVCIGLAALNVSPIKTPKLSGNPVNVVLLATYTVVLTIFYGWQLL